MPPECPLGKVELKWESTFSAITGGEKKLM